MIFATASSNPTGSVAERKAGIRRTQSLNIPCFDGSKDRRSGEGLLQRTGWVVSSEPKHSGHDIAVSNAEANPDRAGVVRSVRFSEEVQSVDNLVLECQILSLTSKNQWNGCLDFRPFKSRKAVGPFVGQDTKSVSQNSARHMSKWTWKP